MKYLIISIILSGCTIKVTSTPVEPHFECMVMCESTRTQYESSKFSTIRDRVEKFCYKQCNTRYLK